MVSVVGLLIAAGLSLLTYRLIKQNSSQ